MATIEKRGNYWRAKVRRQGFPEQTKSFDTRSHAEIWARDVEREMDRGFFLDRSEAERNTLGDLIERYLVEITPLKRGAGPEASRLKAIQRRSICEFKISVLSSAHIARYRDERLCEVSTGTLNKEMNLLRHVLETARQWNQWQDEHFTAGSIRPLFAVTNRTWALKCQLKELSNWIVQMRPGDPADRRH